MEKHGEEELPNRSDPGTLLLQWLKGTTSASHCSQMMLHSGLCSDAILWPFAPRQRPRSCKLAPETEILRDRHCKEEEEEEEETGAGKAASPFEFVFPRMAPSFPLEIHGSECRELCKSVSLENCAANRSKTELGEHVCNKGIPSHHSL
ncbi:uncharacterized protein LOC121917103 isoform X2 [Sceloporus undulatus]|uniref:uncharacterized protein LOC121917103 isoform X2 n=1 Tax=Sceloporus undulatus TaxID=8520 RepID=UPI001C4DB5AF|nr:uncharacterized protein LOC121917103 isoform X2 [Sceloporus undulatus]